MKSILFFTVLIMLGSIIHSCSNGCNENLLLGASDELHYIKLYSNNEFEILPNGINVREGRYVLKDDTILLTYNSDEWIGSEADLHANEICVRKLFIDDSLNIVRAIGKYSFCASIYCNNLNTEPK